MLSVVAPVYNEEGTLPEFVRRVTGAVAPLGPYELVLVDDGSSDGSWPELRRLAEEPISADELERVRGHYEGTLLLALEDSYSVATRNARSVLQRGYARTPEETLALVEAVAAEDILRLAGTLITPSALRLAVVGPFDDLEPFAAALAPPPPGAQATAAR